MSRLQPPPLDFSSSCGPLLQELQDLWNEIGEDDIESNKMIQQLEQECLDVYKRKLDQTKKQTVDLHQALAEGEAEVSSLISVLGEHETFMQLEKQSGTLKEQLALIKPLLEELVRKREERVKEFLEIQLQISLISTEIAGGIHSGSSACSQVDEPDLTMKRLGELKSQLQELQKDKNMRLQKVIAHISSICELSAVLSIDFKKVLCEVHPSFGDPVNCQPKSISNDTLARLAGIINSLKQEKKQRLKRLQDLGSTLIELWNLLDITLDEQKRFDYVTCLISASADEVLSQGCLSLDVIEQAEHGVERLNMLKGSKIKELVLKKQNELEEIYKDVHMDIDGDAARLRLISLIDSGKVDLSELLLSMDYQITKAKEQALSRKDILEKLDKWTYASEEENWLDEYERDQNRYNAGRGAHKNLKRAEKARILLSKISSMVENLTAKVKAWENERGMQFLYNKMPLLGILEEYTLVRQQKEQEKRRSREQKRLQEHFATEQDALFGTKPSPMRQFSVKKPLGQSSCANTIGGTPTGRASTPRGLMASSGKAKKESGKAAFAATPVNYVALSKDDH